MIDIDVSFLVSESEDMENKRRVMEQQAHAQRLNVKVHASERHTDRPSQGDEAQNRPAEHKDLKNRQDLDGLPPKLGALPPEDPEARRKFDNEKNEQDKEKQLRLGHSLTPKFSTAPKPGP